MTRNEQLPLFPDPPRTGLPRPRGVPADDGQRVRYLPYRPTLPRHCDDCVREVQARGWQKAPRIRGARFKRLCATDNPATQLLCVEHKQARELTESHQ